MPVQAESEAARALIEGLTPTERLCVVTAVTRRGGRVVSARVAAEVAAAADVVLMSDAADQAHVAQLAHEDNREPRPEDHAFLTMVRLAQPFFTRYTLFERYGNFGSHDDDCPAGAWYSQIQASAVARALYDQRTDDFRLPLGLLIGRRMSGERYRLVPHAVEDVVRALSALLADPDIDAEALAEALGAPDLPCGGGVHADDARELYLTGQAHLRCEAVVELLPSEGPPPPPFESDPVVHAARRAYFDATGRSWIVSIGGTPPLPGVTPEQWAREQERRARHQDARDRSRDRLVVRAPPLRWAADRARWITDLLDRFGSRRHPALEDLWDEHDGYVLLVRVGADAEELRDALDREGWLSSTVEARWELPLRELLATFVGARTARLVATGLAADASAARALIAADTDALAASLGDGRRTHVIVADPREA